MPRLTEQELNEISRLLAADKPLPEKYRFLLFDEKREVELVWNGKTNEVTRVVLPFQVIEQVDEPRAEKPEDTGLQMALFDDRGRQLQGWTNKLIWGDNKLILSSLKNGPMREEIEKQGGIKLIYIDPPFDVGADFSMDIEIGGDTFTKKPNILEDIAYRDTWGKGADSYLAMIYERLILMRDLLSDDGTIYIHLGRQVSHEVKIVLGEIFGQENTLCEVIWKRTSAHGDTKSFGHVTEQIFGFAKCKHQTVWNNVYVPLDEEYVAREYRYSDPDGRKFRRGDITGPGRTKGATGQPWRGIDPNAVNRHWARPPSDLDKLDEDGKIYWPPKGKWPHLKVYLDESSGAPVTNLWTDIPPINNVAKEGTGYSTQKPEALLERIIRASSNEGDLVADFFCGSGTTAAVAEKLGRKWIVTDLGKFAIHTTRKRMIGVQRELKAKGQDYRAFEILNLGKYERQHYVGVNPNLREEEQRKQQEEKEAAFLELILRAYRAEAVSGFNTFHGKKAGRMVAVGPVNLPVTRLFIEEVILECRQKHITRVDVLGFEFEMGLFPNVLDEARAKGIDIMPKYIPAEVFDKRAVEKNQVVFHDVAFIEVKPLCKKNRVAVQLTDFSVFYSQDSIAGVEASLKNKGSKIVVEKGQIVKVSKNAQGIVTREQLTQHWTDWIDYWAVDFNYENKREIVRVKTEKPKQVHMPGFEQHEQMELPEYEEVWTGDYVFENEWQSFRTRKNRTLELTSVYHECPPGRRKIAVKVVDIFGNDTMTIVDVQVEGKA